MIPIRLLAASLLLLIVAGCDLVNTDGDNHGPPDRVFVANQGNFGDGNGSVTVHTTNSDASAPPVIRNFGSIVQSVALANDKLYVMANSGNRIDVFNAQTLEQTAQISDVVSPRYLLQDGGTGYVTNLYGAVGSFTGGMVTVLDLENDSKLEEIVVGDNPEGMALVGRRLHVANHGFGAGSTLHVIDTETRAVIDTVDVDCDGPRFLAADDQDDVMVFCTGRTVWGDEGIISQSDGAIRVIDGMTGEITDRIELDGQISTAGPGQDAFHAPEEELVFVVLESSTILLFDTDDHLVTDTIGPLDGPPIGAVAFDSFSDRLYVGRSNGFTEAGEVSTFTMDGASIGRFPAGVVPAYIAIAAEE